MFLIELAIIVALSAVVAHKVPPGSPDDWVPEEPTIDKFDV